MNRKTYDFPLNIKALDADGFFAGYASVFDVEDNHNDIILSGAFGNSLRKKHYGKDIKLLWQHKAEEPIGIFTNMVEDEHGLYVEGKLLLEVQRAREAYSLLKSGAVKGLSIGFIVKQYDRNDEGARVIFEADLWEVSLVTFPANDQATITALKSSDTDEYSRLERSIEKAINTLRN